MKNASKYLPFLNEFARCLGWSELRRFEHIVQSRDKDDGKLIVWYESGNFNDLLFQINEQPRFCAAVYAIRFRICAGWHEFRGPSNSREMKNEATRLESWLHRRWFETIEGRRAFRKRHPECSNFTLRTDGPPYVLESADSDNPKS